MRVKVVRPFKDKHTKVVYQKGKEIDITKERFEELTSAALGPFVELMESPKPSPKSVKPVKANKSNKKTTKK